MWPGDEEEMSEFQGAYSSYDYAPPRQVAPQHYQEAPERASASKDHEFD